MSSRIPSTFQSTRPPRTNTGFTGSYSIYRNQQHRPFGMASFTDDDLLALSRRRAPLATPERIATRTPHLARRSMTPLEEQDDESVISAIPTGLRAQQEILSALQKENFRLKLSLHSHRRKETLQNAQLESASSALQDIEFRKNGLEKTLKTLKGEIIAGYRNLEKLVSEQLENDKQQADDRSGSSESSQDIKISIIRDRIRKDLMNAGPSSGAPVSRVSNDVNEQRATFAQRPSKNIVLDMHKEVYTPAIIPAPTRRHILESPDNKQYPATNTTPPPRSSTVRISRTVPSSSRTKHTTPSIELPKLPIRETQPDSINPWIIDVHLRNDPQDNDLPQHISQEHNSNHPIRIEPPPPKTSPRWKSILQNLFCTTRHSRHTKPHLSKPSTDIKPHKKPRRLFHHKPSKPPRPHQTPSKRTNHTSPCLCNMLNPKKFIWKGKSRKCCP